MSSPLTSSQIFGSFCSSPGSTPSPTVLRLSRTWSIICPPAKKAIVAGVLVPTVKGALTLGGRLMLKPKSRRLTIEIHGPENSTQANIISPIQRGLHRDTQTVSTAFQLSKELLEDDRIVVRILKRRRAWGFHRDPEDSSDSESDNESTSNKDWNMDGTPKKEPKDIHVEVLDDGWVEYRKYGMDEIVDEQLTGRNKEVFEATMGLGANQERREFRFESEQQAMDFWEELRQLKALVKERAQTRLEAFQESQRETQESIKQMSQKLPTALTRSLSDMTAQSEIQLLIEIISATHLPIADRTKKSTDPFVVVYLGNEEIHRTRHIPRTLNPIWTIDSGCLCLLSTSAQDFFRATAGVTLVVKDNDRIKANDSLGTVSIPQSTLLQSTGKERIALPLQVLKAHKYYSKRDRVLQPTVYIRARPATTEDRKFMKQIFSVQKRKLLGVYADQTFVGPQRDRVNTLRRESKVVDGVRKFRVKPHPDPKRPEQETKWMSSEGIMGEIMKPTVKWIEAGTGSLGTLFLEVLKCDDLPNMDTKIEGKTDAFCCIIYEDAIVNTDVINDTLSPRWVPWCQRGFLFRISHPSSQLLIGVFDYDSEKTLPTFNTHDAIGRISIDITNFRRSTDYVLTYDLFRSVLANERQKFGTLTVRLRLEYDSYRDFVKGSFSLPPINYINLPQKSGFRCSYFVVHGEENLDRFDMEAVAAYRTELEEYLIIWHYMKKSAISLVLWRGQHQVKLRNITLRIPIHSAIAFSMGITLIENFNLLPSYFLFSIAWLLLTTNEFRQKHPSPWKGSLSYLQLWHAVLANQAPPVVIEAHENEGAIRSYDAEMKRRQEQELARAREIRERAEQIDALFSDERNSAADAFPDDNATKLGALRPTLNPLAKTLLPIQQTLGKICRTLRIVSSIVLWDESIYAFLIVTGCLFLGLILLWFPWSFVLRWLFRISIWIFLGPWMKLVDKFYVQKQTHVGEDESQLLTRLFEEQLNAYQAARETLMQAKEDILKTRAMKQFMFGRFVTRVPQFKEYRYPDIPRGESYAKPAQLHDPVKVERRSHGQTLVGQMIPVWGDAVDARKLEEKTKKKSVAKNSEKMNERRGEETTLKVDGDRDNMMKLDTLVESTVTKKDN